MARRKFYKFRRRRGLYKRVKRLERAQARDKPEKKFTYKTWNATSIPDQSAPISQHLTDIFAGTSQGERVGNKVKVTGMYGHLFVNAADTTNSVRIIVYIPKDPSIALAGLSFYQHPDEDNYTILIDKYVCVSTNGPGCKMVSLRRKYKNGINVQFDGTGSGDRATNPIWIYAVSDSGAVSHPDMSGYLYTYYTDA